MAKNDLLWAPWAFESFDICSQTFHVQLTRETSRSRIPEYPVIEHENNINSEREPPEHNQLT